MFQHSISALTRGLAGLEENEQDGGVVSTSRGKAVQQKRVQENEPKLGAKKGRSAFADITNIDRDAVGGVEVPVLKETSLLRAAQRRRQADNEEAQLNTDPRQSVAPPPRHPILIDIVTPPKAQGQTWGDLPLPPLAQYGAQRWLPLAGVGRMEDMDIDMGSFTREDGDCGILSPSHTVTDIDAGDMGNILACTEFAKDILEELHAAQLKGNRRPVAYIPVVQKDITPHMRAILVDWLVEVAQEYRVHDDTLFLTVAYLDRFLSTRYCQRSKLQLLGVTCMLVAAKYEEIYAPQVDEFCMITDNTYSREEILQTERHVLDALEWELTTPTPLSFLRRFVKAAQVDTAKDKRLEPLALFLAELTLTDYVSIKWLPSEIAASAVLVARLSLGLKTWTPTLECTTQHSVEELWPCVQHIHALHTAVWQSALPATREKFSSTTYKCAASINPVDQLPSPFSM